MLLKLLCDLFLFSTTMFAGSWQLKFLIARVGARAIKWLLLECQWVNFGFEEKPENLKYNYLGYSYDTKYSYNDNMLSET